MPVELNIPRVIATGQVIKIDEIVQTGIGTDDPKVAISYRIFDQDKKLLLVNKLVLEKESYNNFWAGFNSGKFVYEVICSHEGLPASHVRDIVEKDFVAVITAD